MGYFEDVMDQYNSVWGRDFGGNAGASRNAAGVFSTMDQLAQQGQVKLDHVTNRYVPVGSSTYGTLQVPMSPSQIAQMPSNPSIAYGGINPGQSPIGDDVFQKLLAQITSTFRPQAQATNEPSSRSTMPNLDTGQPTNGLQYRLPNGTTRNFGGASGDEYNVLSSGGQFLDPRGNPYRVTDFRGGKLYNNLPLNVIMGQGWLPGQREALRAAGLYMDPAAQIPNTPNLTGLPGQQNAPNPTLTAPNNADDLMRFISQYALDRTQKLDPLYDRTVGMLDSLSNRFNDMTSRQDQLVQQLSGKYLDPLMDIIGRMNTSEGLSPDALSAMRSEATSNIPAQYEAAARALRTQLLQRGAIGSADMPASEGDIIRNFAPLEQARLEAVSGANRQTIMADEMEKKRTLDLNRSRGQDAASQLMQGVGQLADIYNPLPYGQLAQNAQTGALNAFGAQNVPISQMLTAGGTLADMEPGSFKNILLASLLSNLGGGGGGILDSILGRGDNDGSLLNTIINIFRGDRKTTNGGGGGIPGEDPGDGSGGTAGEAGKIPPPVRGTLPAIGALLSTTPAAAAIGAGVGFGTLAATWNKPIPLFKQNGFDINLDKIQKYWNSVTNRGKSLPKEGYNVFDVLRDHFKVPENLIAQWATQMKWQQYYKPPGGMA